jgi:hypothetical protein
LDSALAFARGLRSLAGSEGYIATRVINLTFATRR